MTTPLSILIYRGRPGRRLRRPARRQLGKEDDRAGHHSLQEDAGGRRTGRGAGLGSAGLLRLGGHRGEGVVVERAVGDPEPACLVLLERLPLWQHALEIECISASSPNSSCDAL